MMMSEMSRILPVPIMSLSLLGDRVRVGVRVWGSGSGWSEPVRALRRGRRRRAAHVLRALGERPSVRPGATRDHDGDQDVEQPEQHLRRRAEGIEDAPDVGDDDDDHERGEYADHEPRGNSALVGRRARRRVPHGQTNVKKMVHKGEGEEVAKADDAIVDRDRHAREAVGDALRLGERLVRSHIHERHAGGRGCVGGHIAQTRSRRGATAPRALTNVAAFSSSR